MKQTAIEWFSNKSWKLKIQLENKEINIGEYAVAYVKLVDEAKEMEKEQHRKTYHQGLNSNFQYFEQYYNETFNTKEK
jgi:hypothetical protein